MAPFEISVRTLLLFGIALLSCVGQVPVLGQAAGDNGTVTDAPPVPDIVIAEKQRCGEIIDMHLHLAPWYSTAEGLLKEMDKSMVDRGVLYAVYPPLTFPGMRDANEEVSEISLASDGRIVGLASCNTTDPDWSATRDSELARLRQYLDRPEFVGAKLAPPHTCLPLEGERIEDVVRTVASSSAPMLVIHVGTTPICGPIGAAMGLEACCSYEYVGPSLLKPLIEQYPDVTFILLHAGHDFLPPNGPNFYNGSLVDESIVLAQEHDNVYLEISAMHAEYNPEQEGDFKYPGGLDAIKAMVEAGVVDKIIWGSDGNYVEGAMVEVMKESFEDMAAGGMTDEELCVAIAERSKVLFGMDGGGGTTSSAVKLVHGSIITAAAMFLIQFQVGP